MNMEEERSSSIVVDASSSDSTIVGVGDASSVVLVIVFSPYGHQSKVFVVEGESSG